MSSPFPTMSVLVLVAAACAPAPELRPADGGWGDAPAVTDTAYTMRDTALFPLTGQESLAEAAGIVQATLRPGQTGGSYNETMNIYSAEIIGQGRGAVVLTQSGLPLPDGDLFEAVQHVVEFRIDKETGAAAVTTFGTREKCRHGDTAGTFGTQPCSTP